MDKIHNMPYNVEAEESVLGAIFLKPDSIAKILDIVRADDFYKNAHKIIFEAMLECYEKGDPIDPVILSEKLKKKNLLDTIGGEATILNFLHVVPTAANIEGYAKVVKEKSILRKIIDAGTKIVESASEGYEEVENILDTAEKIIFGISQNRDKKEVTAVRDLIDEEFARLQDLYKNKGDVTGIGSGFKEFDKMTSGFQPSDLVIIGARPSMGKTAFAMNLALHAAVKQKKAVLVFSLEMSNSQIFQRLISAEAKVSMKKIRSGFLDEEEWTRLGVSMGRLAESPIYIADVPNVTVMEVRALSRRLKSQGGLDMILIDYLQLIKGRDRSGEGRQQEISEISRALKGLARELGVPVLALSQLSRALEARVDKRPMLSDLRDSGAIEQDADTVIFLYRDEYYNEDSDAKGLAEVIIGKQRNGPVGGITLRFLNEFTKFVDYTPREE